MNAPAPRGDYGRIPIGPTRKSTWWENALVIPVLLAGLVVGVFSGRVK